MPGINFIKYFLLYHHFWLSTFFPLLCSPCSSASSETVLRSKILASNSPLKALVITVVWGWTGSCRVSDYLLCGSSTIQKAISTSACFTQIIATLNCTYSATSSIILLYILFCGELYTCLLCVDYLRHYSTAM